MKLLATLPPDKVDIIIDFLKEEKLRYQTANEMDKLGHMEVPTGRAHIYAQNMDAMQQMRYAKVAMRAMEP